MIFWVETVEKKNRPDLLLRVRFFTLLYEKKYILYFLKNILYISKNKGYVFSLLISIDYQ